MGFIESTKELNMRIGSVRISRKNGKNRIVRKFIMRILLGKYHASTVEKYFYAGYRLTYYRTILGIRFEVKGVSYE